MKRFYECQCPHGLVPHCYNEEGYKSNHILLVSMPSRASTSLLLIALRILLSSPAVVSMPSRASTSLLR